MLKPWSVDTPLDRRELGKVVDTFEERPSWEEPSLELPACSQMDRKEACMVLGTLLELKP